MRNKALKDLVQNLGGKATPFWGYPERSRSATPVAKKRNLGRGPYKPNVQGLPVGSDRNRTHLRDKKGERVKAA